MTETKNLKLKTYKTATDGQELVASYIDDTSDNFQKIDEFCTTDKTLSIEGAAADAKETGDALNVRLKAIAVQSVDDFDTIPVNTVIKVTTDMSNIPNSPRGISIGIVETFTAGPNYEGTIQRVYNYTGERCAWRVRWEHWNEWQYFNKEDYLVSKRNISTSGITDLNNLTENALYFGALTNISNAPDKVNEGAIIVMSPSVSNFSTVQIVISRYNNDYIRHCWNNIWTEWKRITIDNTIVQTGNDTPSTVSSFDELALNTLTNFTANWDKLTNSPTEFVQGFVMTLTGNVNTKDVIYQVAISNDGKSICYRLKWGTWHDWVYLSGVSVMGTKSDGSLNGLTNNTVYSVTKGTTQKPTSDFYGTIVTLSGESTGQRGQLAIGKDSVWTRFYDGSSYNDWKSLRSNNYMTSGCYKSFAVIGDSYASGETWYDGSFHDNYYQSWGQVMARKNGNTCINCSSGGLTTRSWLTATRGLQYMQAQPSCDLYWCCLGINDYGTLGIEYLGTVDDMKDDFTTNPDTFYGNYGKIIGYVLQKNPKATIILSTICLNSSGYNIFSEAIKKIAEKAGVMCVDTSTSPFFTGDDFTDTLFHGHPTNQTYTGMATAYDELFAYGYHKYKDYLIGRYNGYVS